MKPPRIHRLGDLQLRIMKVLWARGESAVTDVHAGLGDAGEFAYTTIATMLRKMEVRGLVSHRTEGRSFIYRPLLDADHVSRGMADHVLDRLFEGSLTSMVSHLLTSREISREELGRLEKLIAERKRKP